MTGQPSAASSRKVKQKTADEHVFLAKAAAQEGDKKVQGMTISEGRVLIMLIEIGSAPGNSAAMRPIAGATAAPASTEMDERE